MERVLVAEEELDHCIEQQVESHILHPRKRLQRCEASQCNDQNVSGTKRARNIAPRQSVVCTCMLPLQRYRTQVKARLESGQFRWLNEQLYTSKGEDAAKLFHEDPSLFRVVC